ncbi:MAG: glycosyltransferase, partial [Chitinophagaceae bacterium]
MKQKILHIIFNLGRGGAETMLVNVVKELEEYDHVILTLFPENDFGEELQNARLESMDLKLRDLLAFPLVARKLKKIIQSEAPALVHTHLYWPTVLARMATPKNIPLLTTIHAFASQLVDFKKWHLKKLYRYSYTRRTSTMIAVAKGALKEYYDFLRLKAGRNHVLYTFVDTRKFLPAERKVSPEGELKMVSVGALRYQKNHSYLVRAFEQIKEGEAALDIFGEGPLRTDLEELIRSSGVNIQLKGQVRDIAARLKNYDVFIMPSFY